MDDILPSLLDNAIQYGEIEEVRKILYQRGFEFFDSCLVPHFMQTALMFNQIEIARFFLEFGILEYDDWSEKRMSNNIFFYLVECTSYPKSLTLEMFQQLLDHDMPIDTLIDHYQTPLHLSISHERIDFVSNLIIYYIYYYVLTFN